MFCRSKLFYKMYIFMNFWDFCDFNDLADTTEIDLGEF